MANNLLILGTAAAFGLAFVNGPPLSTESTTRSFTARDKDLFPPYVLAPVVRMDTVAGNAKAVEALERVGMLIDNATMQELNRQVELDKKEPRRVAEAFLKTKGVIH